MTDTTETKQPNPLLEKLRLPGESFRLPSQGLFYKDGELDEDVRNGEVEVYPMTAMDEIILNTPDKLLSGKAMVEVLTRCIPSIKKPDKLLSKDVDFLMACLRIVSFGPSMTVTYKHFCKDAKEHSYEVDIASLIKQTKSIDPTTITADYTIVMDNGQKVTLTPLTFDSIMDLYQTTAMLKTEEDITEEDAHRLIIGALTGVIKSVDGDTIKSDIEEWVRELPISWKRKIEAMAQKGNMWGIDLKSNQQCKDCEEEVIIEITPNPVSFFS